MKLTTLKKWLKVSGVVTCLAVTAVVVGGILNLNGDRAAANDCSANAILKCGASSAADFISKVRSGNGGTQNDLAAIYADYGLTSADYNRFVTSAVPGTAYKNGTIVVDGRTVATGAESLGRSQKTGSHPKVINGKTYWENSAQSVFLSNSIPVMVLFNSRGQMQFAVMNDCGNPTSGAVVTPTYSCDNLQTRQVDRTTYAFSTSASAGNGAVIDHVVYDFGDGTTKSSTNPTAEVTHTYSRTGTFSAKVTVYVKLPGVSTLHGIVPAGDCVKQVIVKPAPPTPAASCTLLTVTPIDRTRFRLNATAATSGGATVSKYTFSVVNGSKTVASSVVSSSANSASTTVTVSAPGSYTAKVVIASSVGALSSAECQKPLTVAVPPVASCKALAVTPLDRTTYKLTGKTAASGGASVKRYDFSVKNSSGTTVATSQVTTSALSATTNVTVSQAGTYTAMLTAQTSEGAKTSATCSAPLTVPKKPIPPVPSVNITKDVDGVKQEQVNVGQVFTYHVTVTNNGKVDLKNVAVTDTPPAGVTLTGADKGAIANNAWSYTIPGFKQGQSLTFALTGQVDAFVAGNLVNTACVNAPGVPNQPLCDTATVTVTPPTPVVPTPQTQLPNTGAGNVIGLFAGIAATAAVAYRFFLLFKFTIHPPLR